MTAPTASTPAPQSQAAPGATVAAATAPADRLRPFRRVEVPKEHLPPGKINGRGYDCGCRAATDYDGKIGEEIGEDLANVLKTLTGLKAIDAAKDALTSFLGGIPFIGPAIKTGIQKFFDDIDPLKNLMKRLGKALDALLVDSLIRGVPSWVPAYRVLPGEQERLEQEVEGRLVRSRQRYDSVPFTQWHAWYDWSFRVSPSTEFVSLVGTGNTDRERNDPSLEQPEAVGKTRYDLDTSTEGGAGFNATVDCEWDLGAFGEKPGAFLTQQGSERPIDWIWPMTGSHFWAAGRCVYDCSHATADARTGAADKIGLHLNQLHPCKAIATARHEAVKFDENPLAVPAIQFMFFASRSQARIHDDKDFTRDHPINTAGDFRFDAINDVDYTFVVDLPPAPPRDGPFHIGATPGTLLNTLVPGRPLLHRFEVQNFMTSFGFSANGEITPDIEAIRPQGGGLPTQVRVTIPLTRLSAQIETYGIIVSLGWFDPAGTLARVVHKVTIELGQIVLMKRDETRSEYRVNVAVNGRWFFFGPETDDEVEDNHTITLNRDVPQPASRSRRKPSGPPRTLTLFLAEDDAVSISVHGMEQDGLGDIMDMAPDHRHPTPPDEAFLTALKVLEEGYLDDRLLRLPKLVKVTQPGSGQPPREFQVPFIGDPVVWKTDVDDRNIAPGADNTARDKHASLVARAMFLRLAMQAFDANDLMGLIDPNVRFPDAPSAARRDNDGTDAPNPFTISRIIKEVGFGVFRTCELTAYQTDAFGRMGNLAYDPHSPEYIIRYRVKVERQEPVTATPPAR